MADATLAPTPAEGLPAEPDHTARNRLVIWLLLISTFVVILNETIMTVALPRIMDALSVTASAAQWLTTAYLLTMAVVIPVTGFLIQRIDTRPLYVLAMALFSVGTLVGALSPNLGVLIGARIIQASGTAIMMPLLMTSVMTLVPHNERGRTMGNIMIVISVAPAVGPAVSGAILHFFSWHFLFWLVLPIALAALVLGIRRMQNVTETRYAPVDLISIVLSALAFGGLVYGLSGYGAPPGEQPPVDPLLPLIVGALAMLVFVARQRVLQRTDRALLDLRTFASANFAIAVAMMATMMMVLFGTVILLPIYMQNVIGFDTLKTGLLLVPGGVIMGVLGNQVGRWYDRFGPAPLILPGAILVSAVLWAMTLLSPQTPWVNILIGHMVLSVGLGLVFTPLFTVSLSSVRPELYSHGSAMLGSIQQLAGAAGVALFVAVMTVENAARSAAGASMAEALSGGVTAAMVVGASISLLAIVAAIFIRRPPDNPDAPMHH